MATVEQVRELYAEKTPSSDTIPRNGYFGRELVGVLLDEIDRLRGELEAVRARVHEAYLRDARETNPHEATGDSLLDRLRGIYTVPVNDGAGPLNGSMEFTRKFPPLPLNVEAAAEIDRLRTENEFLRGESDLYIRGYQLIGAMDISNYLARCQEAGKILEG